MTVKPYRIITVYDNGQSTRKALEEIGAKFTEKDVFSRFWGRQFTIDKPTGKGATAKKKAIDHL